MQPGSQTPTKSIEGSHSESQHDLDYCLQVHFNRQCTVDSHTVLPSHLLETDKGKRAWPRNKERSFHDATCSKTRAYFPPKRNANVFTCEVLKVGTKFWKEEETVRWILSLNGRSAIAQDARHVAEIQIQDLKFRSLDLDKADLFVAPLSSLSGIVGIRDTTNCGEGAWTMKADISIQKRGAPGVPFSLPLTCAGPRPGFRSKSRF